MNVTVFVVSEALFFIRKIELRSQQQNGSLYKFLKKLFFHLHFPLFNYYLILLMHLLLFPFFLPSTGRSFHTMTKSSRQQTLTVMAVALCLSLATAQTFEYSRGRP